MKSHWQKFEQLPKYRNKKTIYKGIEYDSKKEANYAFTLDNDPTVVEIKRQIKYEFDLGARAFYKDNQQIIDCHKIKKMTYIADFVITRTSGNIEVIDVKGYKTPEYKFKKLLMKIVYGIEIIEK